MVNRNVVKTFNPGLSVQEMSITRESKHRWITVYHKIHIYRLRRCLQAT